MLIRSILAFATALLVAALAATDAHAQRFRVVVVDDLRLADLERLEPLGAVGLLVPAAGPTASEAAAWASLRRGAVRNSLRDGQPPGPPLIRVERAAAPPSGGPVVVLALPEGGPQPNDRRYPIAVLGGGYRGRLRSPATRIGGLVSIVDVAPTALGRRGRALAWSGDPDAAEAVAALDRRIRADGRARAAASLVLLLLGLGLALALPRASLLAFPLALAANLVLGAAGGVGRAAAAAVFALALAAALPLSRLLRSPLVLGLALAASLLAYLIALALAPSSVALSPLGPTQNSRFYGLSNLLATLLLVPALAAARLLFERFRWAGFGLVALLALATVASSRLGADGGGAIVLAAGYSVLALLLVRRRLQVAAAVAALALLAILALVGLDAATGASSHLTRAFAGGPLGLGRSLAERVTLSYARATADWYVTLLVVAALVTLFLLAARRLRRRPLGLDDALPLAFAAAISVSLLVNDSPLEIALAGLVGYLSVRAPASATPARPAGNPGFAMPLKRLLFTPLMRALARRAAGRA